MQYSASPRLTLSQAVLPQTGLAKDALLVLGFSALVALSAQVTLPLPFTPVPITAQTFGVLLTGAVLGSRRGALSLGIYLGIGALGAPVFARSGGPATWGYLAGFVLAAFVVGWLAERGWDRSYRRSLVALLAGNVALYVPGLLWLAQYVGADKAIPLGLLPFIPGDIAKLLLAAATLPSAWRLLGWRNQGTL